MNHWVGMPEFVQEKVKEYAKIECLFDDGTRIFCRFDDEQSFSKFVMNSPISNDDYKTIHFGTRENLARCSEQKITDKTKSIWFPHKSHWGGVKHKYISSKPHKNRYPIFVVSKGRSNNCLTSKALNDMGLNHYIVVEQSQLQDYMNTKVELAELLVLPQQYLDHYDTCDDLGDSKSKGPGAARNFCIDYSTKLGFDKHWVMDDNLDAFHYLNRNEKLEVECGSTIAAAEDFTDRFSNVPISGLNYYSFCKKTDKVPPFKTNTRIYSCLLIDNHSGYRWRGRYNEDTDICLRVLKDGLCTIQFNTFLCGKVTTQRMKGGNTEEFYSGEGTLPKSQMLADLHPDVAKVVWKFNRWHHHVDYSGFTQELVYNDNIDFDEYDGINNYDLIKVEK